MRISVFQKDQILESLHGIFSTFCQILAVNNQSTTQAWFELFCAKISSQSVSGLGTSNIGINPKLFQIYLFYFNVTFGGPQLELGLLVSPGVPMVYSEPLREKRNEKLVFVPASTKDRCRLNKRTTLEENY